MSLWQNGENGEGRFAMDGYVRLYHFVPEEYGVLNIENRRIKIAEYRDMNDPFELLAYDLGNPMLRRDFRKFKRKWGKVTGLLCFSKSYKSVVQWAHYADRHRGVCLGFDVNKQKVKKVSYISSRLPTGLVNFHDDSQTQRFAEDLFYSKHEGWSYEKEYRVSVGLGKPDKSGLHFFSFNKDLMLKEVIVGAESKMKKSYAEALVKEFGGDVDLFKVRPAFETFRMVRNRSDRAWK